MSKMKDIMIKILNDPKFTGDTTEYMEKIKKHIQKKMLDTRFDQIKKV